MSEDRNCALWLGVLDRALIDATSRTSVNQNEQREQDTSRRWLLGYSADFKRVCDYAGVEPDQVRKRAATLIAVAEQRNRDCPLTEGPRTIPTYEFNGRILTLKQWSAVTGLSTQVISGRLSSGWTIEAALNRSGFTGGCLV